MSVVEIVVAGDSDEAQKNGTFNGPAANEKRQIDVYRSIKTLDELTKQLNDDGFSIHRANKQSPLLMHVEYRVSLPDHDWVVTSQHTLIPSVYAGIVIQPNGLGKPEAVSYSGPTYIAIRSGKYSSSTAYAHAFDFERLLQLHEFDTITKYGPDNAVKPVLVITVDGGPDENPLYQKVIETAVHHFVQNNLDAYFIATNAPCRSAFNRVERRMAPLSKELSGLILPHDKYDSHLNDQGLTIDTDLEKKKFAFAGSTLAEIWSQTVVDSHPIIAEYIDPELSELKPETLQSKDLIWFSAHVMLQKHMVVHEKAPVEATKRDRQIRVAPTQGAIQPTAPRGF
eukprot:Em0003g704a